MTAEVENKKEPLGLYFVPFKFVAFFVLIIQTLPFINAAKVSASPSVVIR